MRITNLQNNEIFLGFIGNHGVPIKALDFIDVPDRYAGSVSLKQMIDDGVVTVGSFSVGDPADVDANKFEEDDFRGVSPREFNRFAQGLFQVKDDWTSTTTPTNATAYAIAGTEIGPYDTSERNVLVFKFDSLYEVKVELPKGQLDIATLVTFLNNNADFTKYGIAENDGSDRLRVLSRALGPNSLVEIIDNVKNAVAKVGMLEVTVTAATGDVAVIELDTLDVGGNGLVGIEHAIKIYTTDSGSGDVVSSEFQIQRIEEGVEVSGIFSAEASIKSGQQGKIKFEVASASISEAETWIGILPNADLFLASVPTSRLQVR